MNIVYKFTSKNTGKFYIGSKVECTIIDGKIVCNKRGTHYYSSSSCEAFWEEVRAGYMELEVLDVVGDRDRILDIESEYQVAAGVPHNVDCYNKCIANQVRSVISDEKLDSVVNPYGETFRQKSFNNSRVARLDAAAIKEGFTNYGDKVHEYLKKYAALGTYHAVDMVYGKRGYAKRFIKGLKLCDFSKPMPLEEIEVLRYEGVSLVKACEVLQLPLHVVRKAYGSAYSKRIDVRNYIAIRNGFLTRQALSKEILLMYLKGYSFKAICKEIKHISTTSASRMLQEEVMKRLSSSDIE